MPNFSDIFLEQYKAAAGEGAVLELKIRMLADKVPGLEQYAHSGSLADVERQVVKIFDEHVTAEERVYLQRCRQLRNKLFHCDFYAARARLHEPGAPARQGGVGKIAIADVSGADLVQRIVDGAAGVGGHLEPVANMESTAEAGVFGWLLELGAAGDFRDAIGVFQRSAAIMDRLTTKADELEVERRRVR